MSLPSFHLPTFNDQYGKIWLIQAAEIILRTASLTEFQVTTKATQVTAADKTSWSPENLQSGHSTATGIVSCTTCAYLTVLISLMPSQCLLESGRYGPGDTGGFVLFSPMIPGYVPTVWFAWNNNLRQPSPIFQLGWPPDTNFNIRLRRHFLI